jgi:hypothetical protein
MIPENDPRVEKLVGAWLQYAKGNGIATPDTPGEQAQGQHVYEFLTGFLKDEYNFVLPDKVRTKLQNLLVDKSTGVSDVDAAALDRVKSVIDDKLTDQQKEQLARELKRHV